MLATFLWLLGGPCHKPLGGYAFFSPTTHCSGGRRSAAARAGASDCAGFAPNDKALFGTHRAFTRTLPSSQASVQFLSPFRLFLSAGAQMKDKNRPETAERKKQ